MKEATTHLEVLVRDRAWATALARRLIADAHLAEDLCQEAWVQALRSDQPPESPRAWTRVVLRHLASSLRRSRSRRERRERHGARPEAQPSTDQIAARIEEQQVLARAVLKLAPHYRDVVLLRFYEDLPPRVIAERLGITINTVHSRMGRGLVHLREELDRHHGSDRRAWVMALAPLIHPSPAIPTIAAAPAAAAAGVKAAATLAGVMTVKTKLVVAAVVIAVVTSLVVWFDQDRADSSRSNRGTAEPAAFDPTASVEEGPAAGPMAAPAELRREPAEVFAPTMPRERLLSGLVLDPDGTLISTGSLSLVALEPATPARAQRRTCSFEQGRYAFPGVLPGKYTLRSNCTGYRVVEWPFVIPDRAADHELDLVLERALRLPVKLMHEKGERLLVALERQTKVPMGLRHFAVVATAETLEGDLPMVAVANNQRLGVGQFHAADGYVAKREALSIPAEIDGVLDLNVDLPVCVSLVLKQRVLDQVWVEQEGQEVVLTMPADAIEDCLSQVTIRFVDDASGEPIPQVSVSISDSQSGGPLQPSDAEGRVKIDSLLPGLMRLTARTHRKLFTELREHIFLRPGESLDLGTLPIASDLRIEGTLVDSHGQPKSGGIWYHCLPRLDVPQPLDGSMTYEIPRSGKVELSPWMRGRILIFSREEGVAENPWVVDATNGSVIGLEFSSRPGTLVTLDARLAPPRLAIATIRDADQIPVWAEQVSTGQLSLLLIPGNYTLSLDQDDGSQAIVPFEVKDEPVHLHFDDLGEVPAEPEGLTSLAELAERMRDRLGRDGSRGAYQEPAATDSPLVLLQGKVAGPDGGTNASLTLTHAEGQLRSVRSQGNSGYYAIAGLRPGKYQAKVTAEQHQDLETELEIGTDPIQKFDISLARNHRVVVVIQTEQGSLEEISYTSYDPQFFDGIEVVVTRENPGEVEHISAFLGRTQLHDLFRDLEISAEPPFHISLMRKQKVLETQFFEQVPESVQFELSRSQVQEEPCQVLVRIVDKQTATPIRPERLEIREASGKPFMRDGEPPLYREDGTAMLTAASGNMHLFISDRDHVPYTGYFGLEPGQHLDLGTIQLSPLKPVHGSFRDQAGNPVQCRFQLIDLELPSHAALRPYDAWFEGSHAGEMEIPCGTGPYRILLCDDRWARTAFDVDTRSDPTERLDILVERGARVTFQGRATRLRLRVLASSGIELWSGDAGAAERPASIRLLPGRYRMELEAYDPDAGRYQPLPSQEFSVGSEDLTLTL